MEQTKEIFSLIIFLLPFIFFFLMVFFEFQTEGKKSTFRNKPQMENINPMREIKR